MERASLRDLEAALLEHFPDVAQTLRPGLSRSEVQALLAKAGITLPPEDLFAIYEWKDGTTSGAVGRSFLPKTLYQFLPLETAVEHYGSIRGAEQSLQQLGIPAAVGSNCFPLFGDGSTGYLALGLDPGQHGKVLSVQFESTKRYSVVWETFPKFVEEAIRSIQSGDQLAGLIAEDEATA